MGKINKKKDKFKFWCIFTLISLLYLFAFSCLVYFIVMQCILSYEKFGVIISQNIFIPHKSAWWLLGVLAVVPALFLTTQLDK